MGKIYKDSIDIEIVVNTGIDLTDSVTHTIEVWKPNGVKTSWSAIVKDDPEDGILSYSTGLRDLDVSGVYKVQAKVTFVGTPTPTFRGGTAIFKVWDNWS